MNKKTKNSSKNKNFKNNKLNNFETIVKNLLLKKLTSFLNSSINTNNENKDYCIKQNKDVKKLRNTFVNNLNEEFIYLKTKNIISKYAKTFDFDNRMNLVDNAHIVPVWYLIKNKRYNDIANPNNGLILDPNTHRIFDKDKNVEISKDYSTIYNDFIYFINNKTFLNEEKIKFFILL